MKPKENLQLELILADNTSTQTYQKGTLFNHKELENVLETKNRSKTMDLNVHFSVPLTEKFSYETTLGGNFLENKYSKNRHPRELAYYFEVVNLTLVMDVIKLVTIKMRVSITV